MHHKALDTRDRVGVVTEILNRTILGINAEQKINYILKSKYKPQITARKKII